MICPGCNGSVGDHEKFCRYCGYDLSSVKKTTVFCSQCGNKMSISDTFCGKCGAPAEAGSDHSERKDDYKKEDYQEETDTVDDINKGWYKPDLDDELTTYHEDKEDSQDEESSVFEQDSEEQPEKNRKPLFIALGVVGFLVVAILAGVVIKMFVLPNLEEDSEKQKVEYHQIDEKASNKVLDEETEDETEQETTLETDESTEESTSAESSTEESETQISDSMVAMKYVDSDTMNYPVAPADFTEVTSPDGNYSLQYPMNFFKTGYYNSDTKTYEFQAVDGTTSMTITEQEASIKNDPKTCANWLLEQYKPIFLVTDTAPYYFESKSVAESGYSRSIIGGALSNNPSVGKYIVTATNSQTTYIMTITYNTADSSGAGVDYTPDGYLIDCLYRGWSISGSTYQLRTYEQYLKDDMGSKK